MKDKLKDLILILVVAGLVVATLMPVADKDDSSDNKALYGLNKPLDASVTETQTYSKLSPENNKYIQPGAAEPLKDTVHLFMPLVVGSKWIYRVEGPKKLIKDKTWTMEIETVPSGEEAGKARAGFGNTFNECNIFAEGKTIRLDCLPFTEPLMFNGNRPDTTTGTFLPDYHYAINNAVWKQHFKRKVKYDSPDKKGKIHIQSAVGIQTDRAMVSGNEQTIVPAGIFNSLRIDWTGRIEIKAGKRKLLSQITSEPYRTETTWFTAGIGMIRRRVEYLKPQRSIISFDLVRYSRPN